MAATTSDDLRSHSPTGQPSHSPIQLLFLQLPEMLTPRQKTSVHQFQTHIEREARTNRDEQGLIGDEGEMGGRELL